MDTIKQLNSIVDFEYCYEQDGYSGLGGVDFYQFGWKDWLHFYLDDYLMDDEYEKRFVGVVYKDKQSVGSFNVSTLEEVIVKVKEFITEFQPTQQ